WRARRRSRCCGRPGSWWCSRRWRSGCSAGAREDVDVRGVPAVRRGPAAWSRRAGATGALPRARVVRVVYGRCVNEFIHVDGSDAQGQGDDLVAGHRAAAAEVAGELGVPEGRPGLRGDPYMIVID